MMVYGLLGGSTFSPLLPSFYPFVFALGRWNFTENFVKNHWLSSASYLGTAEILHAVTGLYTGRPASAQGCRWGG